MGGSFISNDDKWNEAFEFSTRLFSSLAGVVADAIQETSRYQHQFETKYHGRLLGGMGFWFMKDMTDVYDMFMLTFADTTQMNEGRPVLIGTIDRVSYHTIVYTFIWIGYCVVLLRALALVGGEPISFCLEKCCDPAKVRVRVDATLSLCFIEIPYLFLRWFAWYYYGLPVSVMAVKNVLGIIDDLRYLHIIRGLQGNQTSVGTPCIDRVLCCCCVMHRRLSRKRNPKADHSEEVPHVPQVEMI